MNSTIGIMRLLLLAVAASCAAGALINDVRSKLPPSRAVAEPAPLLPRSSMRCSISQSLRISALQVADQSILSIKDALSAVVGSNRPTPLLRSAAPGAPPPFRLTGAGSASSDAECAAADAATSCCAAVSDMNALLASPLCSPYQPIISQAVESGTPTGLDDAGTTAALDAYCPSSCAVAVANLTDTYGSRSPVAPMCAAVHSKLPGLRLMCARDTGSGAYCMPQLRNITAAAAAAAASTGGAEAEGSVGPASLTPQQLSLMCTGSCMRQAISDRVTAAARILSVSQGGPEDSAAAARSFYAKAQAITQLLNTMCLKDPADEQYCIIKAAARGGLTYVRSLREHRGLSSLPAATPPTAAPTAAPTKHAMGFLPVPAPAPVGSLPQSAPGSVSSDDPTWVISVAEEELSNDTDVLTPTDNPVSQPGWACSYCGKALLLARMEVTKAFSSMSSKAARKLDRLRFLITYGCGGSDAAGRTCLALALAGDRLSQFHESHEQSHDGASIGLLTQLVTPCVPVITNISSGTMPEACPPPCSAGLTAARALLGCCYGPVLEMYARTAAVNTGGTLISNDAAPLALASAVSTLCGAPLVLSNATCRGSTRHYVALQLGNIHHSHVDAIPGWREQLAQQVVEDLAAYTQQPVTVFTVTATQQQAGGKLLVVVGIVANSDAATVMTVQQVQSGSADGTLPLTATATFVTSDPGALVDPSAPVTVSDATADSAPKPDSAAQPPSAAATLALSAATVVMLVLSVISTLLSI